MKIIPLSENTSHYPEIENEHGLCLYIETSEYKILFDFGQSDLFCRNAKRLGIDIENVDIAILSHGHYDHGGGHTAFRKSNSHAPLYVSQHAFDKFYSDKYIGLPDTVAGDPNLVFVHQTHTIAPGITLYSGNCVMFDKTTCGNLTTEQNGIRVPDDFRHEIYLLIQENGKSVLFSGCSHRGILQITKHFAPDVLIGGFHFKNLDPREYHTYLENAAATLCVQNTLYYTCHCTGIPQYNFLKERMGAQLHYLSCAKSIEI